MQNQFEHRESESISIRTYDSTNVIIVTLLTSHLKTTNQRSSSFRNNISPLKSHFDTLGKKSCLGKSRITMDSNKLFCDK